MLSAVVPSPFVLFQGFQDIHLAAGGGGMPLPTDQEEGTLMARQIILSPEAKAIQLSLNRYFEMIHI